MKLKEEIEKYNKNKSKNIFDEIIAKDYSEKKKLKLDNIYA